MTPEQEREFRALLAEVDEENSGWRSVMDPVAAELTALRAALAASQAREAALRQALEWIVRHDRWVRDNPSSPLNLDYWSETIGKPALAAPSPAADALGRVARASVANRLAELAHERARSTGTDLAEMVAADAVAATVGPRQDAVDNLLVVAPWWGEPREETNRGE